jgi:hypothetical protein
VAFIQLYNNFYNILDGKYAISYRLRCLYLILLYDMQTARRHAQLCFATVSSFAAGCDTNHSVPHTRNKRISLRDCTSVLYFVSGADSNGLPTFWSRVVPHKLSLQIFLLLHLRKKKMLPYSLGRFQWAAALLLGLRVRMPPGHGCFCLACFQAEVVRWADHSSSGVILTAVCSVWSRSLKNEADLARVGLLRQRKYMFSYFAFS